MKKIIMITVLLSAAFSAQARRGATDLTLKNSMAGFASESIEHSMSVLNRTNPTVKDQVAGASVQIISAADSTVIIELTDGSEMTFNCIRFDDTSRGGTVLKKEVVCRQ
ncbi:MAG: hypothetical protein K9K67_15435 [Bacteriovoracaceae bacterium]|nr:hypothetical protein [Bacteriovoracaceae bacterium]